MNDTEEHKRLEDEKARKSYWRRWGPYLSERQWGTVREDYSDDGDAWNYFSHEHARFRAYRWGEDGIGGICDNHQRLCIAFAFWNGEDPILKERLFGLSGDEGNHGEDVKESYYYLDNVPSHAYMKMLYKYPCRAYPYRRLIEINKSRTRNDPEFELADTGIFDDNQYFDIFFEYAKETDNDLMIKVTACNRSKEASALYMLPSVWFRNTWSWDEGEIKPLLRAVEDTLIVAEHPTLGKKWIAIDQCDETLFTENETNLHHLYGAENESPYVKDAFHRYVIDGQKDAVNPQQTGTKGAFYLELEVPGEGSKTIYLRLSDDRAEEVSIEKAEAIIKRRKKEADAFYETVVPGDTTQDLALISRQAYSGMLWSKQFYNYVVEKWLTGDDRMPKPPKARWSLRNVNWRHFYSDDILSMPDKWEYPWFAAWDLAFHCLVFSLIDVEYAKKQLMLLTREWYMHPSGQIPAYEWNFNDINPPVHGWAAWRVYKIEKRLTGKGDRKFLERVFQKLLLNFTWWVNREDSAGRNIFQGGFLGLDNISVFNRSEPLPAGEHLDQSDATSWMGMYCLNLLQIAIELAKENAVYEDIASKFFEHFLYIADAMAGTHENQISLWDEEDGFFYDRIDHSQGGSQLIKVRSLVGLFPLFAVMTIEPDELKTLLGFRKRFEWFIHHREDLCGKVASLQEPGLGDRRLLAIVGRNKLTRVLDKMLDTAEFLSDFGIRSVSAYHRDHPFSIQLGGQEFRVDYEPAESTTQLFGGNSNWRGPIWFPVNFLLIESLQKFHHYYGDTFKVEFPKGSNNYITLWDVSMELTKRLISIFESTDGKRERIEPEQFSSDRFFVDHLNFNEYFHGDTGKGLGARHQTGWTGLVAKLIDQYSRFQS